MGWECYKLRSRMFKNATFQSTNWRLECTSSTMYEMFGGAFYSIKLWRRDTSSLLIWKFGNWDTNSKYWGQLPLSYLGHMFKELAFNQPIGNWNTSSIVAMGEMFGGSTSFNQPIGNWDTSVTNMSNMFRICHVQDIADWNTFSYKYGRHFWSNWITRYQCNVSS